MDQKITTFMKKVFTILFLTLCVAPASNAQSVSVKTDGSTADARPVFEVKSITKGMLEPVRTTSQRRTNVAFYYMLKTVTLNGAFKYSDGIAVATKANGSGVHNAREAGDSVITTSPVKTIPQTVSTRKITIGPNLNNGIFWFSVSGLEEETLVSLFYLEGKQIKQFRVVNFQQQKVTGLKSGVYFLAVPDIEPQKIIVSNSENSAPATTQTIPGHSKL